MTRPAILPLPSAQLALARARQTIRAEHATAAEIAEACTALETHGDWMDVQTATALRTAQRRQTADLRKTLLITAACTAALLAGVALAELYPPFSTPPRTAIAAP